MTAQFEVAVRSACETDLCQGVQQRASGHMIHGEIGVATQAVTSRAVVVILLTNWTSTVIAASSTSRTT